MNWCYGLFCADQEALEFDCNIADTNFDPLAKVVSARFLYYKVTIFPSVTGAQTPGLILALDLLGTGPHSRRWAAGDRSFICSSLMVKNLPIIQETRVQSLGWIKKFLWRRKWQPIPVFLSGEFHAEESGRLQSMGLQRVGHDWAG